MEKRLEDMSLEELWQLFPIVLAEYNPAYKVWYSEMETHLFSVLRDYNIVRMTHIGSTSVPGLVAKPIIDILMELEPDYDSGSLIQVLQEDKWILMNRNDQDKRMQFNKGYMPAGFEEKVYHLHVRPQRDWDELYFCEYLRRHPEAAKAYGDLKRGLKAQYEHNRDGYTDAKTDLIKKFNERARKELKGLF